MTIRLRPHHLLCLLTYVGRGYTPAFTANYDAIAERLSMGEDVVIVAGPDDICAPLLGEREQHCWNNSVTERDRLAARDIGALLVMGKPIRIGTTLTLDRDRLGNMRRSFAAGTIRPACAGCEWAKLCTTVAADGYGNVRVRIG